VSTYRLEGTTPVPCNDMEYFAQGFDDENEVAHTTVFLPRRWWWPFRPKVEVSTIFMGFDHDFTRQGPPLLFETVIYGGTLNGRQWRYSTWKQAEDGHLAAVALVKNGSA
jgi:hypothetical protein